MIADVKGVSERRRGFWPLFGFGFLLTGMFALLSQNPALLNAGQCKSCACVPSISQSALVAKFKESESGDYCRKEAGDEEVVRWHEPEHFAKARKESDARNRCLLIKGNAHSVDEIGADDPSKGRW